MDLLTKLNEALPVQIGGAFKCVNAGGCGVFAYILAQELDKLGVKSEILWLGCEDVNLRKYSVYYKCTHIFVKVGDKLIDCNGVYDSIVHTRYSYAIVYGYTIIDSYKSLKSDVNKPNRWNSMFDREQIPAMKKKIKELIRNLATKID